MSSVLYEKSGAVATISLNRPQVLNAFDRTMHEELFEAVEGAAEDRAVRCVVLRGEGRAFSTGADLAQELAPKGDHDREPPDLGEYLRGTYGRLVGRLAALEKPVVAALHGPVYGAGLGVALACDLRVAARGARMSVAFVRIGLTPDAGTSFFLPRLVGLGRALEMGLLGEEVGADEAHRIGLVNRVVPEEPLREETVALAERLAALPTVALAQAKRTLGASFEGDLATALEAEAVAQTLCGFTRDHREGVAAFLEKRPPRFVGE
jgi:2-(1,2-epoxy-1,2-dihydrophenyl)acetyl-CoA isomerase